LGKDESILSIPSTRLHLLLLSHYRLLSADPRLCLRNQWTKIPLRLLFTRHPDQGVRYLAVQCYIQQVGLPEKDRVELEDRWVGIQTEEPSAFITYGWEFVPEEDIGSAGRMELQTVEGWGLRTREAVRERNYGNLGRDSLEWISEGDSHIAESDLSPFTAVVGGRLTLRAQLPIRTHRPKEHSLHVDIDSNQKALRSMASLLDRRLPILLTGMASSGKSHLLQYLSMMIYPATPVNSRILTISLADTSIDAKALLGSYVSSPTEPGTFTWVEGALTKAVRSGRWIVLEDIDRAGQEVLSLFARLADSLGISKVVGGRAMLDIPGRTGIEAGEGFALFATRKVVNTLDQTIPATFLGHNYFVEVALPSPTELEVQKIMDVKYPKLAGPPVQALSVAYQKIKQIEQKFSKSALPGSGARRSYGLRDLEKWCARVATCLPVSGEIAMHVDPSADVMRFSNPSVQDEVFLEGVDIFLGSFPYQLVAQAERRQAIARILGEALGLGQERSDWLLDKRVPQVEVQGDSRARQSSTVRVGRASLHGLAPRPQDPNAQPARPYAMTKPSAILLERIAVGITLAEPMLLVGETGTGKTTAVQHVASLLNRPLTVINLSTQTESADLLGGFRPVDAAIPARHLHAKFLDLFRRSFSRKKNEKYEEELRRAMVGSRWKRVAEMWIGAGKLAKDRTLKRLAR
jgi:midasin